MSLVTFLLSVDMRRGQVGCVPSSIENTADFPSQETCCFSYDAEHKFQIGAASLRWYLWVVLSFPCECLRDLTNMPSTSPPLLGVDLSEGFDSFVKRDDSPDEHLDGLLRAIGDHEAETQKQIDAHVVTWRGMMTKVCVSLDGGPPLMVAL